MRVKTTFAVTAVATLVVALGLPASSAGRTVTVGPGESIQAAVDDASRGTRIKVEAGTYQESVRIEKSGIEIVGAGRKATKIVPPADPAAAGCVDGDVMDGICAIGQFNEAGELVNDIDDIEISHLSVIGFSASGIFFLGADDPLVRRVLTANNGEYGIAAFVSTDGYYSRNVTPNNGEAGIYLGDSPDADSTVRRNVSWGNANGIFIRDASDGEIVKNKSFSNCVGFLFLNLGGGVEDWVVRENQAYLNNVACEGEGDEPGLSGAGILAAGTKDLEIFDNGVFGNAPTGDSIVSGGIALFSTAAFGGADVTGTDVTHNTVFGNDPDLFWDGRGAGNSFRRNDCETSAPSGLCPDDPEAGERE
jgi:hypothetical protein